MDELAYSEARHVNQKRTLLKLQAKHVFPATVQDMAIRMTRRRCHESKYGSLGGSAMEQDECRGLDTT